jgi:putative ABC transport system permease protein
MRWTKTLRLRLRSLFRSSRVELELDEELQYHLERLVDEYVARGMSFEDAWYAARREMGAIEQRKEECRDARGVALADSVRQDVTYALRTFHKSPAFTTVAILSLALGIGANTAIFTLWNGLLRSSLPGVEKPEQLVMLSNPDDSGGWTGRLEGPRSWLTYGEFEQMRDHVEAFSAVMASQSSLSTWRVRVEGGDWEDASGRLVSGGFFQVLGVRPAIGRLFTPAEDRIETPYVVLSHSYWQRRFGGRSDVLGKTFTAGKAALTVIGVASRGFIGETTGQQPDVWLPLRMQPSLLPGRDRLRDTPPEKSMWLHVFGRLRPGVTYAQAEAQANAVFQAGLESFYGALASGERRREFLDQRLVIRSAARGASSARPEFSSSLTALLAAVGVLLLIACANLANLLLARGAARQPEIALRLSLGASRGRLVRQLVTESLALAVMGAVAAIGIAYVLHPALVRMMVQSNENFRMTFALEPVGMAFVLATTVAAALLFGSLPAWQVSRADPGTILKEQSRGAIGTRGQMRSGRLLVSLQLALSLPLLVGAGLMARTVYNLQRADLGFQAERLLLVRVDFREAGYETARRDNALRELVGEIQRIPGVRAATYSQLGLFSGGESSTTIAVEGYAPKGDEDRDSALDVVGPRYFSTLGVPITLGREILDSDVGDGPRVCVINEAFAKQFFDRRSPIGLSITLVNDDARTSYQVVGVARNARTQSLRGDVEPRYFVTARDRGSSANSPTFLIRTATDSAPVMAAVRNAIGRVDAALPIVSATSIEEQMAPLTAQDHTTAQLVLVFGCVALTLAAIGLYGVLSYGVARRTGEIAIRIALGARPGRVTSMILRETIGVVCAGLAFGGGLAYAASRLIGSQLYGVAPQDPLTLASATGVLLLVALSAAYLPARRASRVDPTTALRQG